jgi:hypothetical protein
MTDRNIRASDMDRESVVAILRDAHAEGRLTLDEFEERAAAAYSARTWGELEDLTTDLPVQPVLSLRDENPDRSGRADALGAGPLPNLPPLRPEAMPPGMQHRPPRRAPDVRLLPALFIWAVIAAAAGSAWVAGVLAVFFVAMLAARFSPRGR